MNLRLKTSPVDVLDQTESMNIFVYSHMLSPKHSEVSKPVLWNPFVRSHGQDTLTAIQRVELLYREVVRCFGGVYVHHTVSHTLETVLVGLWEVLEGKIGCLVVG